MPHQCTECGYTFPDGSKEMLSGCPGCGGNKFQYHSGSVPDDPGTGADSPDRPDPGVSGAVGRAANTVRDVFGSDSSETAENSDDVPTDAAEPSTNHAPNSADNTADSSDVTGNSADTTTEADASSDSGPRPWPDPDGAAERNAGTDPAKATDLAESAESTETSPTAQSTPDDSEPSSANPEPASDDSASVPPETVGKEDRAQADARSQVVDEADLPNSGRSETSSETSPNASSGNSGSSTSPADAEDADDRPELSELREELNSQFESIRIVEPGQYELNLMELYDREQYIIALQEDGRYVIEVPEAWRDE